MSPSDIITPLQGMLATHVWSLTRSSARRQHSSAPLKVDTPRAIIMCKPAVEIAPFMPAVQAPDPISNRSAWRRLVNMANPGTDKLAISPKQTPSLLANPYSLGSSERGSRCPSTCIVLGFEVVVQMSRCIKCHQMSRCMAGPGQIINWGPMCGWSKLDDNRLRSTQWKCRVQVQVSLQPTGCCRSHSVLPRVVTHAVLKHKASSGGALATQRETSATQSTGSGRVTIVYLREFCWTDHQIILPQTS